MDKERLSWGAYAADVYFWFVHGPKVVPERKNTPVRFMGFIFSIITGILWLCGVNTQEQRNIFQFYKNWDLACVFGDLVNTIFRYDLTPVITYVLYNESSPVWLQIASLLLAVAMGTVGLQTAYERLIVDLDFLPSGQSYLKFLKQVTLIALIADWILCAWNSVHELYPVFSTDTMLPGVELVSCPFRVVSKDRQSTYWHFVYATCILMYQEVYKALPGDPTEHQITLFFKALAARQWWFIVLDNVLSEDVSMYVFLTISFSVAVVLIVRVYTLKKFRDSNPKFNITMHLLALTPVFMPLEYGLLVFLATHALGLFMLRVSDTHLKKDKHAKKATVDLYILFCMHLCKLT